MTAKGIARRLVAKYDLPYAYGLCRGRVARAIRTGRWHIALVWRTVGENLERMGNAAVWK